MFTKPTITTQQRCLLNQQLQHTQMCLINPQLQHTQVFTKPTITAQQTNTKVFTKLPITTHTTNSCFISHQLQHIQHKICLKENIVKQIKVITTSYNTCKHKNVY